MIEFPIFAANPGDEFKWVSAGGLGQRVVVQDLAREIWSILRPTGRFAPNQVRSKELIGSQGLPAEEIDKAKERS